MHKEAHEGIPVARKDTRRAGLQHPEYMPAEWHEFVIHFFLLQAPTSGEGDVVFIALHGVVVCVKQTGLKLVI
ncbi:unnamed protein product [Sphagnum troendelagicum]